MATKYKTAKVAMSRCQSCDHDLFYPRVLVTGGTNQGQVYCSNTGCKFSRQPHPTGKDPNKGLR